MSPSFISFFQSDISLIIPFLPFGVTCLTTESWTEDESPPLCSDFFFLFRALYLTREDPFPQIHLPFPAFLLPLSPLSTPGLQSPMPDQRGASMTCSCVYCQHRPVLGQLGEYEKARQ